MEWQQSKYQGIDPGLLQQLVNSPSKNAAGLNALSGPLFQGVNSAAGQIPQMIQRQRLEQLLKTMQSQSQQPQQQQPPMAGMNGMTQPPPQQPFNGIDPRQMVSALGPDTVSQMIQQKLSPDPNQQIKMQLEQAKINALNRGSQPKPTNPLDDAIKQKRLEMMQLLMKKAQMASQPKPPNPVSAAALDVKTQIANANNRNWFQKTFGKAPKIVNPLAGKTTSASSGDVSGLSDEELMAIVNGSDSGDQ